MRNRVIRFTAMAAFLGFFATGAPAKSNHDGAGTARIEVVDRPNFKQELFRYITWNGERYGPHAFEFSARGKVQALVLLKASPEGIRCAASLSGALAVPASSQDRKSGVTAPILPTAEPISDACSIPSNTPHPVLAAGQYYVVSTPAGLAIEGESAMAAGALLTRLKALEAKGIVVRDPTIGDLFCFGAIAGAAQIPLFGVNHDGTLSAMTVGGKAMESACSRE